MTDRLHPASGLTNVDYKWYVHRIEQLNHAGLYDKERGWLPEAGYCMNWLISLPGQTLPFKLKKWKVVRP